LRQSLGLKRNLACEEAGGPIIAHWDDDDWYASHRLSYQVEVLLREDADACGIATGLFYEILTLASFIRALEKLIREKNCFSSSTI